MVDVTRLILTKSSSDSDSSSSDSSSSDSSSSDSEDAGSKRATYHQWRSYLMKMDSHKNGKPTANALSNGAPTQPSPTCSKPTTLAPKDTRTVVQVIKKVNTVPRTSAAINPIRTVTPALTRTITSAPNVTTVSSPISRSKPTTLVPKYTRPVAQAIKNVNTAPPTSKGIQTVTPDLSASLRSIYETFWSLNSAAKLIHVKSQLDEPSKIYVHKLIKAHSNLVQENCRLKKEKQDLINVIKKIKIAISHETIANLLDPARSTQPKNS